MKTFLLLACAVGCLLPWRAQAHSQSTALVQVESPDGANAHSRVQVDVALIDLQQVIGIDTDGDGAITWNELQSRAAAILGYVRQGVHVRTGRGTDAVPCELGQGELLVDEHADGPYAVLRFATDCNGAERHLSLDYSLLFDINASHRALVSWSNAGHVLASTVLTQSQPAVDWSRSQDGLFRGSAAWIGQGVWHIWTGYDHLLFLATLLLPAVVRREGRRWVSQATIGNALREVVKVVTAFTLAHSLSLLGGVLGWLTPDGRWVESAIALTVLLGALNLLFPLVRRRLWMLALAFGLIHGLGFASTLTGLGLDRTHLLRDLLAFNLGVELGQLAVIGLVVPLAYSQRQQLWYRHVFTPVAACAIGVMATVWLYQRLG